MIMCLLALSRHYWRMTVQIGPMLKFSAGKCWRVFETDLLIGQRNVGSIWSRRIDCISPSPKYHICLPMVSGSLPKVRTFSSITCSYGPQRLRVEPVLDLQIVSNTLSCDAGLFKFDEVMRSVSICGSQP